MKRIRSCKINGKRWRIVWTNLKTALDGQPALGICYHEDKVIKIEQSLTDPAMICEVLVHEMLHGQFPEIEEEYIDMRGGEITSALQRANLILEEDE